MAEYSRAVDIIRKYEGFNERAYPHWETGDEPYTIGYGTQFYPDGSPVKKGQCVTKSKAIEFLLHELQVIESQLETLDLHNLSSSMQEALLS